MKTESELPTTAEIIRAMKCARAVMGWTQEKLGSICGVSRKTVVGWERDPETMSIYHLRVIEVACRKAGVKLKGA